jgi:deazaflavin-dependent oxidoreductase (nitroreductase family)
MGLLTPLAVRIGAIRWLPRLLPQITWIDTRLQAGTRGRLSLLTIAGLPNLLLTVPGRTSGIERTTPLLCVPDHDGWLIAGSMFGGSSTPSWVHNLRAASFARIRFQREDVEVTASELTDGDRSEAWALMQRTWPNYALYQTRTSRVIPVFRLTPVGRNHQ